MRDVCRDERLVYDWRERADGQARVTRDVRREDVGRRNTCRVMGWVQWSVAVMRWRHVWVPWLVGAQQSMDHVMAAVHLVAER